MPRPGSRARGRREVSSPKGNRTLCAISKKDRLAKRKKRLFQALLEKKKVLGKRKTVDADCEREGQRRRVYPRLDDQNWPVLR